MESFADNPAFWVGLSFFIFIGLVWKPVGRALGSSLDKRSERIKNELANATRLREEAAATLAKYEKKQKEIEEEAKELLNHAKQEAIRIQKEAEVELKKTIDKRIAAAETRIALEEHKALQDVQKQVVHVALEVARDMMTNNMNNETDESLIKMAISDVKRISH